MKTILFENPNEHVVTLSGADGKQLSVGKRGRVILDEWYMRYCPKYLRVIKIVGSDARQMTLKLPPKPQHSATVPKILGVVKNAAERPVQPTMKVRNIPIDPRRNQEKKILERRERRVVGRVKHTTAESTLHFREALERCRVESTVPAFSNNIGIGILSYNRLDCLQRCLASIYERTDLTKTAIFVADESTNQAVKEWLQSQKNVILVDANRRLGVAGNTNRLLRCLSRFKHKLLLNDDVEVLCNGWDTFYFMAMEKTGFHHFCHRQAGVYGAKETDGSVRTIGGYGVRTILEKPQGAVLAFDNVAFSKVGFFDESFNPYGMEHVDWSHRISISGIQPAGYHDVVGSQKYFRLRQERSAAENKGAQLSKSREIYEKYSKQTGRIYVLPSKDSAVQKLGIVVPFRGKDRFHAVKAVVANMRMQRFHDLEIVAVEQDESPSMKAEDVAPAKLLHCPNSGSNLFCKAAAFNMGVMSLADDVQGVILHDADMLVQINYAAEVFERLRVNEGCHMGKDVAYLDAVATDRVCKTLRMDQDLTCERTVGYYEGGSLACTREAYLKVGGFYEGFKGYGMEDCEFFNRLKSMTKFNDTRSLVLFHLWHGRTLGWNRHHSNNKSIAKEFSKIPIAQQLEFLRRDLEKWKR